MGIAIKEEQRELADVARAFLAQHEATTAARATLDAPDEQLPPFWTALAELGWLGIHLPEAYGGQGAGLPEAAVLAEALGATVAPGPYLPTVVASALLADEAHDDLKTALLPGLADGSVVAGVGLWGALHRTAQGRVSGDAGLVLGGGLAQLLVLSVGDDVVVVDRDAPGVRVELLRDLDPTRRVARVHCDGVAADRLLHGARARLTALTRSLAGAEAAGAARACTEMAVAYAKERVQFGRVIGTFQAVKHLCADMLADAEMATASAWDAARAARIDGEADLAAAVAAAIALPAFLRCAERNIQVHGGIGFTWEHDAHLYLRRAGALLSLVDGERNANDAVIRLAREGVRRTFGLDLPPEAEALRVGVRDFVDRLQALPEAERRVALVDEGYLYPHWPAPYGRAAGAVEQLVIEEEFADVPRPNLGIGGWITLTITSFGNDDQQARWVRQALVGDIYWCQLFSEPNAGSDAANVQTSGTRVDGGWLVNGQKVWTSGAHISTHGWATVRTNRTERKHDGITMMVIDMKAAGVEVRPLRQITGGSEFNEVFFTDVFVPDDDVVGPVDGGWKIARATLGNERVSIGGNAGSGGSDFLLGLVRAGRAQHESFVLGQVGELLAEGHTLRLLGVRQAERAVVGAEPAAEGNVAKLLGSEHNQRVARMGLALAGPEGAVLNSTGNGAMGYAASDPALRLLQARGSSIAGGTSEIARNQIAERLLGLPRDPLLK